MSEAQQDPIVFQDTFKILDVDPDGKKFDKVSRFRCRGDLYEMDLLLDVNTSVYNLQDARKFDLVLARTLHTDGSATEPQFGKAMQEAGSDLLIHDYEYVMYGKVFKFKETSDTAAPRVEVYVSFGGLLMQLTGDPGRLVHMRLDDNIFLLIKKFGRTV